MTDTSNKFTSMQEWYDYVLANKTHLLVDLKSELFPNIVFGSACNDGRIDVVEKLLSSYPFNYKWCPNIRTEYILDKYTDMYKMSWNEEPSPKLTKILKVVKYLINKKLPVYGIDLMRPIDFSLNTVESNMLRSIHHNQFVTKSHKIVDRINTVKTNKSNIYTIVVYFILAIIMSIIIGIYNIL